jgi:hypothetical protein
MEETEKEQIIKPSFSISLKEFPDLTGLKVKDKFIIQADVRVTSVSANKERIVYVLEIENIKRKEGRLDDEEFKKLSKREQEDYMRKESL